MILSLKPALEKMITFDYRSCPRSHLVNQGQQLCWSRGYNWIFSNWQLAVFDNVGSWCQMTLAWWVSVTSRSRINGKFPKTVFVAHVSKYPIQGLCFKFWDHTYRCLVSEEKTPARNTGSFNSTICKECSNVIKWRLRSPAKVFFHLQSCSSSRCCRESCFSTLATQSSGNESFCFTVLLIINQLLFCFKIQTKIYNDTLYKERILLETLALLARTRMFLL